MSFIKCDDKHCLHCSRYQIRATKTISLFRAGDGYISWPTMTYSNQHYHTFLQRSHSILSGQKNLYPDQNLLSGTKARCSKCNLPYIFLSKADEDRHNQWIYPPTMKLKRSSTQMKNI
ncbi:unnamed protein product, partial [Rotaria sp. Silwood2]